MSQQIRGSCSPDSRSSRRREPIPVFSTTIPGRSGLDRADAGGLFTRGTPTQRVERSIHVRLGNDRDHPSLARDVERIQAEQLAGAADSFRDRDRALLDLDADPGIQRELVERRGQPSPRSVAEAVRVYARIEERGDERGQGRTVAFDRAFELQPLPDR